ncbi:protein-(glutamine-N5) methyltransferase, release factor-specific [Gloeothece citriformis PCC 7424]|uniref:Release factor glutamine methyltransferase n=1 Tax=Gloeothece citriformis (strain PCC 7424) TaxID=65393 RepID=B7KEH0_GLOC7|nr:peptide chain release factor N(5)-glutamine methyltransferase [Gloeothece citriformis]ACK73288.1 protein-(glutamine-N5) methyltransferase, release factor-specific [Gloeothece citriformis PCC 7424]
MTEETLSGEELAQWRNWAKQKAIASRISPTEVDWLLQEVANLTPLDLRLNLFQERSQISLKYSLSQLTELWQQRLNERLPVQYLVGVTPWRKFRLKVSHDVLIPRPETEYIIDIVQKAILDTPLDLSGGNWVDLGTGSGAIALGLADLLTNATIYAVDTSLAALEIAEENAIELGLKQRIIFKQGSWWDPLEFLKGQINGMVSNPPYIPTEIIPTLQPEVAYHEPTLALDGGEDGLMSIDYLVEISPFYLRSGGIWLIEMMAGQGKKVVQLLENQGSYQNIQIFPDLAGIDRFVLAYLK